MNAESFRPADGYGLAPKSADVRDALHIATARWLPLQSIPSVAAQQCKPLFVGTTGRVIWRDTDVARCARQLAQFYQRGVVDYAELAAGVAAAVAAVPVALPAPLNRLAAAEAGILAMYCALDRIGYTVNDRIYDDLIDRLARRPEPTSELVRMLSYALSPAQPRPRVLLLTPLNAIDDDEQHCPLVQVATLVRDVLGPQGFAVDCPGERLHPDTVLDWPPSRMYDCERRLILGAGLVALISADLSSWGLGQSQSWAEGNLAVVRQFANRTSRVLGPGSQFDTITDPWESPETTAERIIVIARRHRARMIEHDGDRSAIRREWAGRILRDPPVPQWKTSLARRRQSAITTDPVEAASSTLSEIRELRKTNPDLADDLVDTITGRPTVRTLRTAEMSESSRSAFDDVCDGNDATFEERDLVLRMLAHRAGDLVHRKTELTQDDVQRTLDFLRGRAS